jgi:hypothetical protein
VSDVSPASRHAMLRRDYVLANEALIAAHREWLGDPDDSGELSNWKAWLSATNRFDRARKALVDFERDHATI